MPGNESKALSDTVGLGSRVGHQQGVWVGPGMGCTPAVLLLHPCQEGGWGCAA